MVGAAVDVAVEVEVAVVAGVAVSGDQLRGEALESSRILATAQP